MQGNLATNGFTAVAVAVGTAVVVSVGEGVDVGVGAAVGVSLGDGVAVCVSTAVGASGGGKVAAADFGASATAAKVGSSLCSAALLDRAGDWFRVFANDWQLTRNRLRCKSTMVRIMSV